MESLSRPLAPLLRAAAVARQSGGTRHVPRWRSSGCQGRATALVQWLPVPVEHRCCFASQAAASHAAASSRLTFMQQQALLQQQSEQAASATTGALQATAAALASTPSAADSSGAPAASAPPAVEAQLLSEHWLRLPAESSKAPVQTMSPLQLLSYAGFVSRVGSQVVLLPHARRALHKLEALLNEELAPSFHPQRIELFDAPTATTSSQRKPMLDTSETPYNTSFAAELPLLTQLLLTEFRADVRQRPLASVCVSADVAHPMREVTASPGQALWSASKRTRDMLALDTSSHARALERYQRLLDTLIRWLANVSLKPMLVEARSGRTGPSGIDSDLTHEIHVPVSAHAPKAGGCTVLRCDRCDYAARRERAVSIPAPAAQQSQLLTDADAANPQRLPPALHAFLRRWALEQLAQTFPPHVPDHLSLAVDNHSWKVELAIDASSLEGDAPDEQAGIETLPPVLHVVFLRSSDEFNVHALGEHISASQVSEEWKSCVRCVSGFSSG